jgi:hypothetical protein
VRGIFCLVATKIVLEDPRPPRARVERGFALPVDIAGFEMIGKFELVGEDDAQVSSVSPSGTGSVSSAPTVPYSSAACATSSVMAQVNVTMRPFSR